MDKGMTQVGAEALAGRVSAVSAHDVSVEPDDGGFIVTVRRSVGDLSTLYDDQDWGWLRERILSQE